MKYSADWESLPDLDKDRAASCSEFVATAMKSGDLGMAQGSPGDAVRHFQSAVSAEPMEIGHIKLAAAHMGVQKPALAVSVLESGLKLFPESSRLHYVLSAAHSSLGNIAAAEESIDAVLRSNPEFTIGLASKVGYLSYRGEYDAAYELLKPLLKAKKPIPKIVLRYARIAPRIGEEKKAIKQLLDVLKYKRLAPEERVAVHFSLGDLMDKAKQFDPAFYHFKKGNELTAQPANNETIKRFIDTLIEKYQDIDQLPKADQSSELPLFVIGMPRSGTSLVEKILSSHAEISAGGELQIIKGIAAEIFEKVPSRQYYPLCADEISKEMLEVEAEKYIAEITALANGSKRFTEKLPHNFLYLGLINQLLPNTRIIHCVRDPLDVCLSCYFQNFAGAHGYTNDLVQMAEYYREYERMMTHWIDKLSLPVLRFEYSQLVDNPEAKIRELVEFTGLVWDENCLDFHKTKATVATASSEQVRNPIYKSSVSRWENYKRHIGALKKTLEA